MMSAFRLDIFLTPVILKNNKVIEELDAFNGDSSDSETDYDTIYFSSKDEAFKKLSVFNNWDFNKEEFKAANIKSNNHKVACLMNELKDTISEIETREQCKVSVEFEVTGYLKNNDEDADYINFNEIK